MATAVAAPPASEGCAAPALPSPASRDHGRARSPPGSGAERHDAGAADRVEREHRVDIDRDEPVGRDVEGARRPQHEASVVVAKPRNHAPAPSWYPLAPTPLPVATIEIDCAPGNEATGTSRKRATMALVTGAPTCAAVHVVHAR